MLTGNNLFNDGLGTHVNLISLHYNNEGQLYNFIGMTIIIIIDCTVAVAACYSLSGHTKILFFVCLSLNFLFVFC